MTNVEALKKVYVALGGDADDFTATTNPEAIDLIASAVSAAVAPELPAVTSADNGDILKVVDGVWAKASS
jgi:hypothetical protein